MNFLSLAPAARACLECKAALGLVWSVEEAGKEGRSMEAPLQWDGKSEGLQGEPAGTASSPWRLNLPRARGGWSRDGTQGRAGARLLFPSWLLADAPALPWKRGKAEAGAVPSPCARVGVQPRRWHLPPAWPPCHRSAFVFPSKPQRPCLAPPGSSAVYGGISQPCLGTCLRLHYSYLLLGLGSPSQAEAVLYVPGIGVSLPSQWCLHSVSKSCRMEVPDLKLHFNVTATLHHV